MKIQKEEVEEEVGPITKLSNERKLPYDEYLEKLLQAFERTKIEKKEQFPIQEDNKRGVR